ncbi:MAG: hypothetical protein ACQEXX_01975 [Bacillota bacterium]
MLLLEKVNIKWNSANKNHFVSKGYEFTKMGDQFLVYLCDILPSSKIKIKVVCDKCNANNQVTYGSYIKLKCVQNHGFGYYMCHKCALIEKTKSTNDFKKEVYALVKDEYVVKSEYLRSNLSIRIYHQNCGKDYSVTPNSFLNGKRCPHCYGVKTYTHREFLDLLNHKIKKEYQFLEEYQGYDTKILVKHLICGHLYRVTPHNFLKGRRCPKCANRELKSHMELKKEFYKLLNNEYTLMSKIERISQPIKVKHNMCGYIFEITPSRLYKKRPCPRCSKKLAKNTEVFKKEVAEVVGNEYIVLSDYSSANEKIRLLHCQCSKSFYMTPSNFLRGQRCPRCNTFESKGENKVDIYLTKNSINFKRQFKIDGCKLSRHLPFDFCILENHETKCLIEYDGRMHYHSINHFGGENTFKLIQKRDKIKNDYCIANNIPLIRIPYWDYNRIEEILDKELNQLGVINLS